MTTASLGSQLPPAMQELRTRPLFAFQVVVAKPSIIGKTPGHDRRVGEVTGGTFEGERLRGKILSGGSDWQTVRSDGAWTLDVRMVLETDDGALIGMTYLKSQMQAGCWSIKEISKEDGIVSQKSAAALRSNPSR